MNDRIKGAIAAAVIQGVLGYVLITQLAVDIPVVVSDAMKVFEVAPRPPPPPLIKPPPPPRAGTKPKGAPSPPNLKSQATPIVAPPPLVVPPILPPPVTAAITPDSGSDPSTGAAEVRGPGTGSGGQGTGDGGGGDGGGQTGPRWLRGNIRDFDYPREAGNEGIGQTMTVQFTVEPNGRVSDCTILQSSGSSILDDATCRLIERRYRYEPSREADGTPVPAMVVEDHTWRSGRH